MANYNIYQSDGTLHTVVAGSIDTTFYNPTGGGGIGGPANGQGIQLIGQNTIGYGAAIAQTFLQMTENFCSSGLPPYPALQGQLWFNQLTSTSGTLYVRTTTNASGSALANWQQILTAAGGNVTAATFTSTQPTGTPPFTVMSTSQVTNLNAEYAGNLDGGTPPFNQILYQSSLNTTAFIPSPTVPSTFLQWNGTNFIWGNAVSVSVANNLAGGLNGYLPYQTAVNTTNFIVPTTNGFVLTLAGGVPVWAAPGAAAGVSSFNLRTGAVNLTSGDVTTALGYTPPTPTGIGATGTWGINISGNASTANSASTAATATTATTAGSATTATTATNATNATNALNIWNNSSLTYDGMYRSKINIVGVTWTTGEFTASHFGPRVPDIVRMVAHCATANNGYVAGDEIDLACLTTGSGANYMMWANATTVGLTWNNDTQVFLNRSSPGSAFNPITVAADWSCYAYCIWL